MSAAISQLSIYGGQGQAGTLILSAHAGQVVAALSTVDSGPAGASLSLDTGGGFDLSSFATGAAKGFTGRHLDRDADRVISTWRPATH